MRVPKTWPVTSRAASEARNTAIGAFLSGVICWILATRARSSSVRAGIDWVIRLHAQGDRQFERTLNRFMSVAIAFDKCSDAELRRGIVGLAHIADQPRGAGNVDKGAA